MSHFAKVPAIENDNKSGHKSKLWKNIFLLRKSEKIDKIGVMVS